MNDQIKVTFLGTGTSQGVPMIGCGCKVCSSTNTRDKRLRSSVMIETGGKVFVIDTGPDFRQQMLREKVVNLDAVLFTHEHIDHIAGLDDIRAFNYLMKKPVEIYASVHVQNAVKKGFSYIFDGVKYPGIPQINLHTIDKLPFSIDGVKFIPVEVMHFRMPVLGFRVGGFTYITDASHIPEKEKAKIMGSKVVALNALRKEKHISHFTLDAAVQLLAEINPGRAYLIHISHQLGTHEQIEKELPPNIRLAYDGLKILV